MSITAYNRKNAKTISGNKASVFIAKRTWIDTITYDADLTKYPEITALAMETGKTFKEIQGDIDGVMYTGEGQGGLNYFSTQTLQVKITAKSKLVEALIKELKEDDGDDANEYVIIRVDEENNAWLSGISRSDLQGAEQPWATFRDPFTSGQSVEDVDDGNKYTLTWERLSGARESLLSTALRDTILDGTAAFIDFAV